MVTDSATGLPSGNTTLPETNTGRSISGMGFVGRVLGRVGAGAVGLLPPGFPEPGWLWLVAATGNNAAEQTKTTSGVFIGTPGGLWVIIRPLRNGGPTIFWAAELYLPQ